METVKVSKRNARKKARPESRAPNGEVGHNSPSLPAAYSRICTPHSLGHRQAPSRRDTAPGGNHDQPALSTMVASRIRFAPRLRL